MNEHKLCSWSWGRQTNQSLAGCEEVIFDIFVNKKSLRLSYWRLNCVKRQVGKVLRGTNDYAIK